ncbi:Arm DNA-binding domain-containing protein [Flavisolibacter nicotianae]|uniref:Arm DNA-binding domain-containing protein n=1 Tax=Flavisolibacter nicotianae TaxID=2364882 RepID=UPI0013C4EC7F|nr:Arm DNA-binding domain-containing protein [Flavisolibacter nicotianae]
MILPFVTVVFNWRNDVNQSGLYSIYLRITINRASRYYKIEVPQKIAPRSGPVWRITG